MVTAEPRELLSKIEAHFKPQNRDRTSYQLKCWSYWAGSLGSHVCERIDGIGRVVSGTIRMTNGVYDGDEVGAIKFEYIDFVFEREVWIIPQRGVKKVRANAIRVGEGADYMPVQGTWSLEYFFQPVEETSVPEVIQRVAHCSVGTINVPLPSLMKGRYSFGTRYMQLLASGIRNTDQYGNKINEGELWNDAFGIWMPYGIPIPNDGGLKGIASVYGYEQDYTTLLFKHRLNRQRSFIECRHAKDGRPVLNPVKGPIGYNLERTNTINSKLPRFWIGVSDRIYEDIRAKPRQWNSGTCAYQYRLEGGDNGYSDYNGQHLIRAAAPALAMWRMYRDECALLDLEMLLQDTYYAHPEETLPRPVEGQGSGFYGRREPAWVSFLRTEMGRPTEMPYLMEKAQMVNGLIMRQPYSNTLGSIPSPYEFSDAVLEPLPKNLHYSASMEEWLTNGALVSAGLHRAARRQAAVFLQDDCAIRMKGYCPKFFATGYDLNPRETAAGITQVLNKVNVGTGKGDYAPWLLLGLMAWVDALHGLDPAVWIDAMIRTAPPTSAKANTREELLRKLRDEYTGRDNIVAALSALEHL